jgi:hypothetical protein
MANTLAKLGEKLLSKKDRTFLSKRLRNILRVSKGAQAVMEDLLASPASVILKFNKIWRGIDTCLVLAFPTETKATTAFKAKWWAIIARLVNQHRSTHFAAKEWKQFANWIYLHFGGSIQPLPSWKESWPELPEGTWLLKQPGTLSREELLRSHLVSNTRVLPCGDGITANEALEKHWDALCNNPEPSATDLATLEQYARITAKSIKECIPEAQWARNTGHISISNSACYESTRSEGGRRRYVLEHLKEWLEEPAPCDESIPLPTGESVIFKAGVLRKVTVKPPHLPPGSENPRKVDSGLLTEDFTDTDQERIGFQLFAWSFLTLFNDGYIDEFGYPTGKPFPVERKTVAEPGNKVRVVTKSLAAFVTYGQPWGHLMKELLSHDPTLRAGLGAGAQLFEWLKRLGAKQARVPSYVMVGDFESSTDHINHKAGRIAMHALCDELGLTSDYIRGYLDMLLSSRLLEIDEGVSDITCGGCLMGEPGTKVVLTFLSKVSNTYAHLGKVSPHYATAGDDQIDASDDPKMLLRYADASRITTMKPSLEKWGIMQYCANYCQSLVQVGGLVGLSEIAGPKTRLLSPETKQGRGDHDVNPAYGKAYQFAREASWSICPDIVQSMLILFLQNMNQYISYSHELFTPCEWGGLGLPGLSLSALWPLIPEWKQCAIQQREQGCFLTRRLLARWSKSQNFERGIVLEQDSAEEAYTDLVMRMLPTEHDYRNITDIPAGTRFREVRERLDHLGWMSVSGLVQKVLASQRYQEFWQLESRPDRGYKTVPWIVRNSRLARAYEKVRTVAQPPSDPPKEPNWYPETWVYVGGTYNLESEVPYGEPGEITVTEVPLLGKGINGPRVFLHYSNDRLARNASRSQRH